MRWVPRNYAGSWRSAGGSASSPSASSPRRSLLPSSIPEKAHLGALAGLPRSSLFGAPELELCKIGGRSEGQYYEVVATAPIAVVAAAKKEEEEEGEGEEEQGG